MSATDTLLSRSSQAEAASADDAASGVYDLKQGWATVLVRGPQLLRQSKLRATLWTIAIKQSYTIKRSLIPAVALQDR